MTELVIRKLDPPVDAGTEATKPIRLTLEEELLDLDLLARQLTYRQKMEEAEADAEAARSEGRPVGRRKRLRQPKRKKELKQERMSGQQRGMSWKLWNHYSWLLDITEIMERMSPGYLAHLAQVDSCYGEVIRRRWARWCRRPENFIAQPLRINWWDWWAKWVEAGELDRFKDELFRKRGQSRVVKMQSTDVICRDQNCPQLDTGLAFMVRYGVILDEDGTVAGLVPTVDDNEDPLESAGRRYSDTSNKARVRRRCPWCGTFDYYDVELQEERKQNA